jgi:hypothetical protein
MPPPLELELDLKVTTDGAQLTGPAGPIAAAVPVDSSTLDDATVDPVGHDEARGGGVVPGAGRAPVPDVFRLRARDAEGLQLRPGPIGDERTRLHLDSRQRSAGCG